MSELTVETGPLRGQTLLFSESDQLVIGRADDCTLQLDGPGIADRHLVIKALKSGGFGVKKLEASFLLNGRGTEAARLKDGDLLEVGSHRLRIGPPVENGEVPRLKIEGFSIKSVLGRGGHGTVYRAEQLSLHREIALKVLNQEMTQNPEFIGRFVAEARAAARLSHPNVVHVLDVGHDGETYYLSMEIMERGSLEDRLKAEGRIPVEECLRAMIDAAKGLAYAESMRIVHRDIKPDNIMVDGHGVAKIADLGLAMTDDHEQGRIVGTPHFMSPEQVLNRPLDHRSDLYSLGCTFFRLVTGRTLFQARTTKEILTAQVKKEPESADEVNPDVPAAVAAIIDQLVEKDPDHRYQSAEALLEDLHAVLHPPAKRGTLVSVIAVLALAAGGGGLYWGMSRPDGGGASKTIVVTDPKIERELRETKALNEFIKISARTLPPLELAAQLESFSKHANYTGTKAAGEAVAKATELRKAEADRVKKEAARTTAVQAAIAGIEAAVQKALAAGDIPGAAAALQPAGVAAELLQDRRTGEATAKLRPTIVAAAGKVIDGFKAAIEKARGDSSPDGMEAGLGKLDAVLERGDGKGWPAWVFPDRSETTAYSSSVKKDIRQLRAELASERTATANVEFHQRTLGPDGILAKFASFDTEGAMAAAQQTFDRFKDLKPGPRAQAVLAVVTAAKAYEDAFVAAIAKGEVTVPVEIDKTVVQVQVKGLVKSGDGAGVRTATAKGDSTIPLSELRGRRLADVFVPLQGATTAVENRMAFLALHALHEHLSAAAKFMAAVDPKEPLSGTGPSGFTADVSTLTTVVRGMSKLSPPWGDFLRKEVRAARDLSRALRAFSRQQYGMAQEYLEGLEESYASTLAVQHVR